jgi:hypothetical protein
LPLRTGAELARGLHQVVDSPGFARETLAIEEVVNLCRRLAAFHDREVIVKHDRPGALDDDGGRTSYLTQPLSKKVRVSNGGRERDETHRGRRENEDFLPHSPAKGILQIVNFVENDET